MKFVETNTKKNLEENLNSYINDKRSQDECSGFIDGYKTAEAIYKIRIAALLLLILALVAINIVTILTI